MPSCRSICDSKSLLCMCSQQWLWKRLHVCADSSKPLLLVCDCVGVFWDCSTTQASMRYHKENSFILLYMRGIWAISGRNDSLKWAKTTHPKIRPNRPRLKWPGRNDPRPKRLMFETTHGRNPFTHVDFTAQKLEKYQDSKTCFTLRSTKIGFDFISFYCIFENRHLYTHSM